MRIFHRIELDQTRRGLNRVGMHTLHVASQELLEVAAHRFILISAAQACACKPSPCASSDAIKPSVCAPASLTSMMLLRFWKSYTPSGLEKRAVLLVGSTWFGPAQ